jgi:hypothetical protein
MFDAVAGSRRHGIRAVLQAWKAGPETVALRRQLQAMADGGTFASRFRRHRSAARRPLRAGLPRGGLLPAKQATVKVLVLDANQDLVATGPLFRKAWTELYGSTISIATFTRPSLSMPRAGTISFDCRTMCGQTC